MQVKHWKLILPFLVLAIHLCAFVFTDNDPKQTNVSTLFESIHNHPDDSSLLQNMAQQNSNEMIGNDLHVAEDPPSSLYSMVEKRANIDKGHRNLATAATASMKRPVMYTFYVRIDPEKHVKYTGMSDSADRTMLQLWKQYWERAGWKPKILTLEDAKKHKNYDTFERELDLDNIGYAEKLCFLRWLAVSSAGGGFLAHYDIFPIRKANIKLSDYPNGGKLTVYDQTLNGGMPSLISGSKEEYDRVSNLMLESTMKRGSKEPFWNEMLTLFDIYRHDPGAYLTQQGVLRGEKALDSSRTYRNEADCWNMASSNWAIHFSHYSIEQARNEGHLNKVFNFNARPTIAERWLNQWESRCRFVLDSPMEVGKEEKSD